jgi:hypothetical protein
MVFPTAFSPKHQELFAKGKRKKNNALRFFWNLVLYTCMYTKPFIEADYFNERDKVL